MGKVTLEDLRVFIAVYKAGNLSAAARTLSCTPPAVSQHIKRLGLYKCDNCGFRARQYYWRCPGCQKWETYSPKRTEAPDGYA